MQISYENFLKVNLEASGIGVTYICRFGVLAACLLVTYLYNENSRSISVVNVGLAGVVC